MSGLTLSLLSISIVYPVSYWILQIRNIKTARFVLFTHPMIALAGLSGLYLLNSSGQIMLSAYVWFTTIIAAVGYSWNNPHFKPGVLTAPSIFGLIIYFKSIGYHLQTESIWTPGIMGLISGLIFSGVLFLSLGSNLVVQSKNKKSILEIYTVIISIGLVLRAGWDTASMLTLEIADNYGDVTSLFDFILSNEKQAFHITVVAGLIIPVVLVSIIFYALIRNKKRLRTILLALLILSLIIGEWKYLYILYRYGIVL